MSEVTFRRSDDEESRTIAQRLIAANQDMAGPENVAKIALSLNDGNGTLIGGIIAFRSWQTLIIDTLWIDEDHRRKRYASQLLIEVEQQGVSLGCRIATLETFSFQAEGFYARHGYSVIGQVKDWPPDGHLSRMVKSLNA